MSTCSIKLNASWVATALCLSAAGVGATEYGVVVSSTPVVASVPVSQRECFEEPVSYQQPGSGVGALFGAIAGAAIGNTIGSGAGRAAATGFGLVAGTAIGDRLEASSAPPGSYGVQRCRNVTQYEDRTIGYDVIYDYQGVRRTARLARDPGDRLALDVSVVPAGSVPAARRSTPPPAFYGDAPPQVYFYDSVSPPPPPPRVIYLPQPYPVGPPVYLAPWPSLSIGIGGSWGHGGGWRRHH